MSTSIAPSLTPFENRDLAAALRAIEDAGASNAFFGMYDDIRTVCGAQDETGLVASLAVAISTRSHAAWASFHRRLSRRLSDACEPDKSPDAYERLRSFVAENDDLSNYGDAG